MVGRGGSEREHLRARPRLIADLGARAADLGATRALLVTRSPTPHLTQQHGVAVASVPLFAFLAWPERALRGAFTSRRR